MKKVIGTTANGINVYSIIENEHMLAHSDVLEKHITEAISKIAIESPFLMEEINLGRIIGKDNCIEIQDGDDVRMMRRIGRKGDSKIVFGREAEETSLITVGICLDDDGLYTVFTAFYGQKAPKEPWDCRGEEEKIKSEIFWSNHALVYKADDFN